MERTHDLSGSTLVVVVLAVAVLVGGCATGPRYGASRKHSKSCDCPHWNAVPKKDERGIWSMNEHPRAAEHDVRN